MPSPDTATPRVLLLDDDPAVANVIAALIKRAGYAVVSSASGQDAMHLLDEPFDALVLDLRLPGMRGDAFYYAATARQPWLEHRAVFLTGDISEQAEDIIGATGCLLLRKPQDIASLVAVLHGLVPHPGAVRVPRVS